MRKFEFLRGYGKARAPWLFLEGRGSLEGPLSIWRGISNDFFLPLSSSPTTFVLPQETRWNTRLAKTPFLLLIEAAIPLPRPSYQRSHFALTRKRPSMDRRSVTSPVLRRGSTRISDSRFKETRFRFFVRTYRLNLLPFGATWFVYENFSKVCGTETSRSIWISFGVVGTRRSINLVDSSVKTILFSNVNIVECLAMFSIMD